MPETKMGALAKRILEVSLGNFAGGGGFGEINRRVLAVFFCVLVVFLFLFGALRVGFFL